MTKWVVVLMPPHKALTPVPQRRRSDRLNRASIGFDSLRRAYQLMNEITRPIAIGAMSMLAIAWLVPNWADAGGNGLNVAVVVNSRSLDSLTIANWYQHLRDIPSRQFIVLDDVPSDSRIDVDTFREKILGPMLRELDKRQLGRQVNHLTYSAGFPYRVNFSQDLKDFKDPLPKQLNPAGSINGMTYLFALVQAKNANYAQLGINYYYRMPVEDVLARSPFLSNTEQQAWGEADALAKEGKYREAAERFVKLSDRAPAQYGLAYRGAQCLAAAGELDRADQMLSTAVRGGWPFREFLESDAMLEPIRGRDAYQAALIAIEPSVVANRLPPKPSSSIAVWSPQGIAQLRENAQSLKVGLPYIPTTVLAAPGPDTMTLAEAIGVLRRGVGADASRPSARVVFAQTRDVRTKTRQPLFDAARKALDKLGIASKIGYSGLPIEDPDTICLFTGTARFQWPNGSPPLMPGAIGDNLTSTGGILEKSNSQTMLTEFLRNGAAGASGTVIEPYAIAPKFADAFLPVYYGQGATLAEAYYQSVFSPFQLLIVGDPLCQPFAKPIDVQLDRPQSQRTNVDPQASKGAVEATPKVSLRLLSEDKSWRKACQRIELYVDGVLVNAFPPIEKIEFNMGEKVAGHHQIQLVAVSNDSMESRRRLNHRLDASVDRPVTLEGPKEAVGLEAAEFEVRAEAKDAKQIRISHFGRELGTIRGSSGKLPISIAKVGRGPVQIQATAEWDGQVAAPSVPLTVYVPIESLPTIDSPSLDSDR
jgi:tetratricopeptide (TPR) repeat protein